MKKRGDDVAEPVEAKPKRRQNRYPENKGKGRGSHPNSKAALHPHRKGALNRWWKQPPRPPQRTVAPDDLPIITKLAAQGTREEDIARAIHMAPVVWRRQREAQPEVAAALADGKQQMHDRLIGKLFAQAIAGNVIANLFLLKTRFGYREGDQPVDQRPVVNITLPAAVGSIEDFRRMVTVEPEPAALLTNATGADD